MTRRYTGAPWETDPADLSWVGLPVYDGRDLVGTVDEEGPGRVRVGARWVDCSLLSWECDGDETWLDLTRAGRDWWEVPDDR